MSVWLMSEGEMPAWVASARRSAVALALAGAGDAEPPGDADVPGEAEAPVEGDALGEPAAAEGLVDPADGAVPPAAESELVRTETVVPFRICTCASGCPFAANTELIACAVTGFSIGYSSLAPPSKSIERFNPRKSSPTSESTTTVPDSRNHRFLFW